METWWTHGGHMVETWWTHGGNMVETWWTYGGHIVETCGRALAFLWRALAMASLGNFQAKPGNARAFPPIGERNQPIYVIDVIMMLH